jgi:hypothetical protein
MTISQGLIYLLYFIIFIIVGGFAMYFFSSLQMRAWLDTFFNITNKTKENEKEEK